MWLTLQANLKSKPEPYPRNRFQLNRASQLSRLAGKPRPRKGLIKLKPLFSPTLKVFIR